MKCAASAGPEQSPPRTEHGAPRIVCRSSFEGRPDRVLPWCEDSPTALEALRAGGQPIASSCSGATVCGRCGVFVIEGGESLPPADATEEAVLRVMGAGGADERLACRLPRGAIDTQIVLRTNYW